jgi:hypothetical protein
MSTPVLRPLGVGETIDAALKIAWRNLGTLIRIVAVVIVPTQLLVALIDVSAIPDYRPGFFAGMPGSSESTSSDELSTILGATATTVVISFLAGQLATGACFRAVAQSYLGQETSWRASLGFAMRKFHSILWIVIAGGFLTGLGTIFCLIPGIYLYVGFAVALPVLMSEGQCGRKALGRSRALVRGRWWKTFWTLVVGGFLAGIISGGISGLITALAVVGRDNTLAVFLVTAVAGTAGALLSTPFSAAYHTVIYFDLRVRKEAFDLRLLASRLGVEPGADWQPAALDPLPPTAQPPFWPPPPGWKPDDA